jgi:phospholipid/cholesterol/gamma-HCH transport system permease protein
MSSNTAGALAGAAQRPNWTIDLERPDPLSLVARLRGSWRLQDGLPAPIVAEDELSASLRSLRLEDAGISAWDSGLVTSLAGLIKACRSRGIEVDKEALPEGARHLLDLAFAVPESVVGARSEPRYALLAAIGMAVMSAARQLSEMSCFLGEVVLSFGRLLRGKAQYRRGDLALLVQDVGPDALPIVSLISFLVGLILAYMGAVQLEKFGAQIYIADLVAIGMVREIAALMTGIILAGRTGASFAAQLGTMQVNEEIDAFRTLGISPIDQLVLPRIVALLLMVPLLTLYASFVGMVAGMVAAKLIFNIDVYEYYHETLRALDLRQFAVGLSKGTTYGALVALAGCLRGMQCGRSAQAVGEATTSAVVTSILLIVIAASVLTVVYQQLGV